MATSDPPPPPKPEVGDILLVIHDFTSRSTDELSLAKGDRVELIERDDEFGDGWYLGRHTVNDQTGLFPEVYTRLPPKFTALTSANNHTNTNATSAASKPTTPPQQPASDINTPQNNAITTTINTSTTASTTPSIPEESAVASTTSSTRAADTPPATLPLSSITAQKPDSALATPSFIEQALARLNNQDSHVLNDTLNVIDEHITDLRSPSGNGGLPTITDSGSDYSVPIDHRMSYIQGEETDEEEDAVHTRAEVESWNPDQVAEYLFTACVEKHHCEVFRDQEISGEVLLGMDQSSLFIKALDLGSVGRRLKTWQKIKALQDEVNSGGFTRRTTQTYGSEISSEDARRVRSRTSTVTPSSLKMSAMDGRPSSSTTGGRRSTNMTPRLDSMNFNSPVSPNTIAENPAHVSHARRPSAASVRDLHHSRRHSSIDYRGAPVLGSATSPSVATSTTFSSLTTDSPHKKQPSFDRNWTMGGAYDQPRPLSSSMQDIVSAAALGGREDPAADADRGYFSGTEVDGRRKNVLKKRESVSKAAKAAAKTSYAEEQRVRSATTISRHSRYNSIDSVREGGGAPSAVHKYYGIVAQKDHRRTASTNTTESVRPIPPAKDGPAPVVTRLDVSPAPQISPMPRQGSHGDWFSSVVNKPVKAAGLGLRAISDSVTSDRNSSKVSTPTDPTPKESPVLSPARTGSTTPSAGRSLDLDPGSEGAKGGGGTVGASAGRNAPRKKNKKETSAYTRGLQKTTPREAMKEADYSGWMRKKSSNLMTMWKPRLFVLKGRRLAYYYSEDDEQEKGLIDISFHRVLPADNEKLTGLHATITGAGGSTPASTDGGGGVGGDELQLEKGDDSVFIFKLVPPRTGLSRAVNFTKPTVHYFAVPNLKQGRLWMAALMKATIDRDDTQPITTTYQQKTISLAKARAMRHRPPALMGLDEEEEGAAAAAKKVKGEADSGISGLERKEEKAGLPMSA